MSNMPNTFKITSIKTGENRRFPASKTFAELKQSLSSFWGEHPFVLTYRDEDNDVITVSTELEFQEALTVAEDMKARVLKFNAFRNEEEFRTYSKSAASTSSSPTGRVEQAVHMGIVCDKSGMSPIVGTRYHVPGADYDLCEAEYEKLPETERVLFVKIEHPAHRAIPCGGAFGGVKHPGMSCPRARCPRMARVSMPMFDMPSDLSVDDLILQASIAASLFNDEANGSSSGNPTQPFAHMLGSFIDAAGVAAVHAATNTNGTKNGSEGCCKGENPLADLLSGLRNLKPPTPQTEGKKTNCSGGGGGGGGCPMKNKDEMRSQCQAKMREKLQKLHEECNKGGHPLAHFFSMVDQTESKPSTHSSLPVHMGVECDKSGMNPIVGARYTILGANYDLCAEEFENLPEVERMLYSKISAPGQEPIPCHQPPSNVREGSVGGSSSLAAEDVNAPTHKEAVVSAAIPVAVKKVEEDVVPLPSPPAEKTEAPIPQVPTATIPEASEDALFENELLELAKMGFVDRDTNLALLKRYQGRVERVINFILEL